MSVLRGISPRIVRGIRDSIPADHFIGRFSRGDGPAELIPLTSIGRALTSSGLILSPDTLSQAFDTLFGATEGMIIQRGPSVWQALSPSSTANLLLASGGTGALNSWKTLSALLDAAFASTQGDILYRSASGWTVLAPGTSGQFLKTLGASANPAWANALTALTGDVMTAAGTGSVAATLATVNSNVGTFTNATITVNAKGLVTAASSGGGGSLELTDGTTDLTSVTKITVSHLSVSGTSAAATLDVASAPKLSTSRTIQITGDLSWSVTFDGSAAASAAGAIQANVVTYAKMQQSSAASILLGRGAGAGAGNLQEITLGPNLSLSGTVLSAVGGAGGLGTVSSVAADGTYLTTSPSPITTTGTVSPTDLTTAAIVCAAHSLLGGL